MSVWTRAKQGSKLALNRPCNRHAVCGGRVTALSRTGLCVECQKRGGTCQDCGTPINSRTKHGRCRGCLSQRYGELVAPASREKPKRQRKPKRVCETPDCENLLSHWNKVGRCSTCLQQSRCDRCGTDLSADNRQGRCRPCINAEHAAQRAGVEAEQAPRPIPGTITVNGITLPESPWERRMRESRESRQQRRAA